MPAEPPIPGLQPLAVTVPPLIVTVPAALCAVFSGLSALPPIPALKATAVAISLPVPPDWPKMVRLLPLSTAMPALAVRVLPSARIRFTLPLTVMRLSMVTSLLTTYQPLFHVVVELPTDVALDAVCCTPFSSR